MNELILVVEDSRTQAMVLENLLQNNNFRVAIAYDGNEALDWLAVNNASLVLSDVVMPHLNGYELCRKIKEQKSTKHIPVILLTLLSGTDEVIHGLNAGADSFITKPFDKEYLISHIRKILTEKRNEKSGLKSSDVEIVFEGENLNRKIEEQQTINLLLNIYEGAINQNRRLLQSQEQLNSLNENLESIVEERTLALLKETKISKQNEQFLKTITSEVELKNAELLKVNAEKDKFFSIIAHDLRGPLSSFLGLTRLMAEDLPNMAQSELEELAATMEKSASSLFRLLDNLLEWAKIQRGLVPFNPEVIQLHSIVNESIETNTQSIKAKEIIIALDIAENIVAIADKNMIQTIIRNLVSNAIKFTPKGGQISLSGRIIDDKDIEISIKDSGIGISPAMLGNLFQMNTQSNRKGTEGEPSSGLGLLLCKEFIEKLGGKIWVESEEGKGSVFHFTLPCRVAQEEKIETTNIDLTDEQDDQVNDEVSGLKILIAEDDEDSEMLISLAVKPFGKEVLKAKTGVEAVEACHNNPDIDLVLMDIRMPEMDGYEATRQIRQFNSDLVIVAQTAFAESEFRKMAIEAGCTDHISKPINNAELAGLVKKYFRKTEKREPETVPQ